MQSHKDSSLRPRDVIAIVLGCLAFVFTLFFYGAGTNLVMLAGAVTLLVLGTFYRGVSVAIPLRAMLWLLLVVFALVGAQLASLSPDSSFPAAWVLALVVLGCLYGHALGAGQLTLWRCISAIVLALALLSAWRLVMYGERPGAPLTDFNNYAALLYVVALPLGHSLLRRAWQGAYDGVWYAGLAAIVLLSLVISGTGSRASLLVLAGASLFWLGYAFRQRLRVQPVLVVIGCGLIGVLLYEGLLNQAVASAPGSETIAGGMSVRLTLTQAALAMYSGHVATGIGLFVFPLLYRQVRGAADEDSAGLFVHNDYIQLLVEGGPLLFIPLIVLAIWVGTKLFKAITTNGNTPEEMDRLGYLLALGALLAHASVNFVFYTAVLSLLIGLLIARVLPLADAATQGSMFDLRKVVLLPAVIVGLGGLSLLWLDVITGVMLQNQPAIPFGRAFSAEPATQLRYSLFAQDLNPRRGVPFLAEAAIMDQQQSKAGGSEGASRVLQAYRDALRTDAWNTNAWWMFRDFVLRSPQVVSELGPSEMPAAIVQTVLELDPIFVPAIEARIEELASSDPETARRQRLEFLSSHLGPRLTWIARQDQRAAIHYVDLLIANAGKATERSRWEGLKRRVLAVQPLSYEMWFVGREK